MDCIRLSVFFVGKIVTVNHIVCLLFAVRNTSVASITGIICLFGPMYILNIYIYCLGCMQALLEEWIATRAFGDESLMQVILVELLLGLFCILVGI